MLTLRSQQGEHEVIHGVFVCGWIVHGLFYRKLYWGVMNDMK